VTSPPYTPAVHINAQRVAPRRAIAELLSCDIAEVETYQRRQDTEHGRQQYQVDGRVYVVIPNRLLSTPAPVEGLPPTEWELVGTVHPSTSVGSALPSGAVAVLYRLGS
jgi:hypothetical protein